MPLKCLLISDDSGIPFYSREFDFEGIDATLLSGLLSAVGTIGKTLFKQDIATIVFGENIQPIMGEEKLNDKQIKDVIAKYVDGSYSMTSIKQNHQNKEQNFITAFNKNDQSFAEKVLKLAKKCHGLNLKSLQDALITFIQASPSFPCVAVDRI